MTISRLNLGPRYVSVLLAALAVLSASGTAPAQVVRKPAAQPVKVETVWSQGDAKPGERRVLAVVIDIAERFHITGPASSLGAKSDYIPTKLVIEATPSGAPFQAGAAQYPAVKTITVNYSGESESLAVFEGKTVLYVPVVVNAKAAPGKYTLAMTLTYQACDDKSCLLPADVKLTAELNVLASDAAATAAPADAALFAGFDARGFDTFDAGHATTSPTTTGNTTGAASSTPATTTAPSTSPTKKNEQVKFEFFGTSLTLTPASVGGFVGLLAMAFVGGLLLNFTPCVLPIIPIKIMGLSRAAGSRARCLQLGAATSLGVLAFWVALAWMMIGAGKLLAGGKFGATNQLYQTPYFPIGVGVVIAIMAVGMCGVFSLRLPQFVYSFTPSLDSLPGSFNLGVLTAVLSTPCTAPFMGAAAAWAVGQTAAVTLTVFAAIGAGMAAPYLLLAAFPALVHKMPRSGPASELIKQVMGLLMLAAAAYFIGVGVAGSTWLREPIDPPGTWYWWIVAAFIAIAGVWLAYGALRSAKSNVGRAVFVVIGVALAFASIVGARTLTSRGPIAWTAYTPTRYEEALRSNKVVVLDFTAEWCINCKVLEATVLHTDAVASALSSEGVAPMKVDITTKANVAGLAKLADVGRVAIPVLVVVGPDGVETLNSDAYTSEQVIEAIRAARKR